MVINKLGSAFTLFLVGRLMVWIGGAIAMVAFPLAIWHATGDARWTAALTALETAPYLVFGLPAGALADRLPRRVVMGITGIGAATILAVLAAFGTASPWALVIAATLTSSLFVFADAAGFGFLPELVDREHIANAVSSSTAASTMVVILGPALGGALVGFIGVAWGLGIDAALVAAGSLTLLALPQGKRNPAPGPAEHSPSPNSADSTDGDDAAAVTKTAEATPTSSVVDDIREGLHYLFTHRLVRSLTLLGIGNSLAGGMLLGLLVPMVSTRFGMADRVGLAYSALGVGTLCATLALPRLSKRISPGIITTWGLGAVGIGIAAWAYSPGLVVGLIVLALYQMAASVVILNGITIRHLATPEHLQARVNTTARMIAWGGEPLGAALAGTLTALLSPSTILLIAACTVLCTAALAPTTPLIREGRRFHEEERAAAKASKF